MYWPHRAPPGILGLYIQPIQNIGSNIQVNWFLCWCVVCSILDSTIVCATCGFFWHLLMFLVRIRLHCSRTIQHAQATKILTIKILQIFITSLLLAHNGCLNIFNIFNASKARGRIQTKVRESLRRYQVFLPFQKIPIFFCPFKSDQASLPFFSKDTKWFCPFKSDQVSLSFFSKVIKFLCPYLLWLPLHVYGADTATTSAAYLPWAQCTHSASHTAHD